ncbi:MAG: ATP-grasp domain-containing protein [Planctomycetes bacterium]|nr:ATP-grasp domain-containing protein [Planctomycetota bacterium]
MELLFCNNPEMRKVPEPRFEPEVDAAREVGFICHLMGFEDFLDGREERALQFVPPGQGASLLYRGWMFKESEYQRLHSVLRERGYTLFTSPDAYAEAHYLPNYYQKIAGLTPPAAWTEGKDLAMAWRTAKTLGDGPWIVKDYVKSAKQRWESACFIPGGANRETFEEVCRNLIAYQGERFERGFVFKKFVQLSRIGKSPYGYPLCEEYRLFFFKRRLLAAAPYDREGGNESEFTRFEEIASRFQSEFLTIDIAKDARGNWLILEVGDGGVSMLPPRLAPTAFYQELWNRIATTPNDPLTKSGHRMRGPAGGSRS